MATPASCRERFLAVMDYQPRSGWTPPLHFAGPWPDTFARWHREGLPPDCDPLDHLGVGDRLQAYNYAYAFGLHPRFERKVLEETADHVIFLDDVGRTVKDFKNHTTMPEWLTLPVQSEDDLRRIIDERFDPARMGERFPPGLERQIRDADAAGKVLICNDGGFYWVLRELAGVDGASFLLYDAPDTVNRLFDRLEEMILEGMRRLFPVAVPDVVGYGEDIAFKTGPLLSPAMFREFILPRYRRILDYSHAQGVRHTWYDSDGDLRLLLPDMLAIGIDGIAPCEVAAGMQPNDLRRRFGRDLRMLGGIDKREIAKGRHAIDAELARLRPVFDEGGFIPCIDHSVASDTSWDDYQYFVERMQDLYAGRL